VSTITEAAGSYKEHWEDEKWIDILISDNISLHHLLRFCPFQKTLLFWQLIIILSCLIKKNASVNFSSEYTQYGGLQNYPSEPFTILLAGISVTVG
jgi:hypothetical protein